MSVLIHK